jgi:hypothetical protein
MTQLSIADHGSVQVVSLNGQKSRVYRCKNGRYANFKVRWKAAGEWQIKTFSDRDEAIRKAKEVVLSGACDSLDSEIFELRNDLEGKVRLLESLLNSTKELLSQLNQVERNQNQ